MKAFYKIFTLIIFTSLFIVSCEVEDTTGDSSLNYTATSITISASENDFTVSESSMTDSQSYTITASIPEPVAVDLVIDLSNTSGTATNGSDFEFDKEIIIYSGQTSATGNVTIHKTADVEGDEDFSIDFSCKANASINDLTFNATITDDFINDLIGFTFDWSGSYTYSPFGGAEVTIDYCEIDMDFLLFDSDFNMLAIFDAATSSCPEHFDLSGLADGTYYLVADMWANPLAGLNTNQDLPITISYDQEYFGSGEFIFSGYNTNDSSGTLIIGVVEVSGGYNYVVTP